MAYDGATRMTRSRRRRADGTLDGVFCHSTKVSSPARKQTGKAVCSRGSDSSSDSTPCNSDDGDAGDDDDEDWGMDLIEEEEKEEEEEAEDSTKSFNNLAAPLPPPPLPGLTLTFA
jgi:hypothetical protein